MTYIDNFSNYLTQAAADQRYQFRYGIGINPNGTDDTANIQAALAAAPSGGVVQLAPGTYYVSSRIILPPNVTLQGTKGNRIDYSDGTYNTSVIKPLATFTDDAVLRMLDKEEGSYAAENNGQRIKHLTLDGSLLVSSVGGIKASGNVRDVIIENVAVQYFTGRGLQTISYTRADLSSNKPHSWDVTKMMCRSNTLIGYSLNGMTDCNFVNCETIGSGGGTAAGWFIAGCANSHFIDCRAEFSGGDGFRISGSWGTGQGSGGATFTNISTDRNTSHGIHVDATGNPTLNFNGLMLRRDGKNGGGGGGGFSGFFADAATTPIVITNISVYPGVEDDGTGSSSPQIGFKVSGCTYVSISSGYLHAQTTAFSDGGGNTMLLRGPLLGEATGPTGAPVRATPDGWTLALSTNDQVGLNFTNSGTQTNAPVIDIGGAATGSRVLSGRVVGEAVRRFDLAVNGTAQWGGGAATREISLSRIVSNVLGLGTGNMFRTGIGATGSRPSASQNGAQWFDSTLQIPIWADGTNWRNAAGTVV